MISVIIPTLNEAAELPETLRLLQCSTEPFEVWVIDGGSSDETIEVARAAGARPIVAPTRGRAAQMNLGAALARGDILLFLHADTWLNPDSLARATAAIARGGIVGGAFQRRFRSSDLALQLSCALADWRSRAFGLFLGDQAIFVRRRAFEALGGFPALDSFEDVEFSLRMRRAGPTALVPGPILSSARRFGSAPLRRSFSDFRLAIGYLRKRYKKKPAAE